MTVATDLSARIARLRDRALARGNGTGGRAGERALAMMRAWRDNPGCSWGQHRAFTLLELVRSATLAIGEDSRIAGEHLFDTAAGGLDWGGWHESARAQFDALDLPADQKADLEAFLRQYNAWRCGPVHAVGIPDPAFTPGRGNWGTGGVFWASGWIENHSVRDFAKVVRIGFGGIRDDVRARLDALDPCDPACPEAANFWNAALAVCDAGILLGRRYAELARREAERADSPGEQRRLLEIAEVCDRVPARGARTFREATQALWFAHVLTCAEDNINANSIGRLDQILAPYYEQHAGDEALETMEELATKLYLDYDVQQICLGGQTPDGADGANEVTYIILEATRQLGFIRCISVRLHPRSPERLVRAAADLVRAGGGIPFFFNDDAIVRALTDRGIALEDARDYAPIGCVEITIPGRANPHAVSGWLNAAKCLELALFDGVDPRTGETLGSRTGALTDFATFDELVRACEAQVDHFARKIVYWCNRGELAQREAGPMPCWSVMTDDCIARGRDITDGGARYLYHSICFLGAANVADSLAALRKLVFDDKRIGAAEILDAVKRNFEGAEPLRRMLLNDAPKYGNDVPEVDELAADACRHFCTCMDRFRSPLGSRYFVHLFSFKCNVIFGKSTGALPDGRLAGQPLAYSLSPHQGRDQEGVTALMKSLAHIPHHLAAGSSAAIIEIDPVLLEGDAGLERMVSILRTGIDMGIGQMQFNVVSADQLEKALADPEHFGNVQVRVAGYSSRFCLLEPDLQRHIIARTKHQC